MFLSLTAKSLLAWLVFANVLTGVFVDAAAESRFELSLRTKSGSAVPFDINCRQVVYVGEPCLLCVARDVTQAKALHNQLIRSERLAATGQRRRTSSSPRNTKRPRSRSRRITRREP
mgnify:CR=1 FL=1